MLFAIALLIAPASVTAESVTVEYQQPDGWSLVPNPLVADDPGSPVTVYSDSEPEYSYDYDRTTGLSLVFEDGELVPSQDDIDDAVASGQLNWEDNPVHWFYNEREKEPLEYEINNVKEVDYSLSDIRMDDGWNYALVPPELARTGSKITEECRPSKIAFWTPTSGPGGEAQSWNVWSPTNSDELDYNAFVLEETEQERDGSLIENYVMRPVLMYFENGCTPKVVTPSERPTPPRTP